MRKVHDTEKTVRQNVRNRELTQAQFDALVSLAYNLGPHGGASLFHNVDHGNFNAVAGEIGRYVYVHRRDAHGRHGHAVVVHGLVNRRREEATPFVTGHAPAAAHPARHHHAHKGKP